MENTQDGNLGDWFKITVPYGIKYDRTWLMNSIQSHCSVPFTPVDFHYVNHLAQFFVQDASAASALKDINYKIFDEENQKIPIFVNTSAAPYSVSNKLEPEKMEQLKLTISKRYDVSQKTLDLHKLRFDPGTANSSNSGEDLLGHDIIIILNRRNYMTAILQTIKKNIPELLSLNLCKNKLCHLDGLSDIIQIAPTIKTLNLSKNELKSAKELDKIKGLKLEELWLQGNPLCNTFPNQPTYIRTTSLYDGQDLPPPTVTGIVDMDIIKPCKESFKGPETLKNLVFQFLLQYYLIYDSEDRESLLSAYHEEACFSLTVPFNSKDPALSNLCEYLKDNRNMKNLKDSDLRFQLLKHTKCEIVNSLCVFPKTQHDLNSYVVDLWAHTEIMLCFSVSGVFKEVEGKSQGSAHAFTRTFILSSGSNSSMCIMNDILTVGNARTEETQSAFSIPVPTPTFSSLSTLSQEQQEMVQSFSIQSGISLQWSQKCLQDNEWNYIKAAQVFTTLKAQGKIPEEAFKQTS
ncbi:Nuclear RNA export factor 2 [Myotis davidii]|uniref:Nuclear RNA export factor 2 n=1 Tax=Myotis davidii TaxID=225400 RepID=L5LST6_MYODS|nr:Nuclear RNA export factor 2 [Myotis davidii]